MSTMNIEIKDPKHEIKDPKHVFNLKDPKHVFFLFCTTIKVGIISGETNGEIY